jgi:site-specific DNA-cytosine methylase
MTVKYEIKSLYKKKQQLNHQLYKSHLENAYKWDIYWTHIEQTINHKPEEMKQKHLLHNQKLEKLTTSEKANAVNLNQQYNFYPKIVNKCKSRDVFFLDIFSLIFQSAEVRQSEMHWTRKASVEKVGDNLDEQ